MTEQKQTPQKQTPQKRPTKQFSPEVRSRAVSMVLEHRGEHTSEWAAMGSIAAKIGCTAETLRNWVPFAGAWRRRWCTEAQRRRDEPVPEVVTLCARTPAWRFGWRWCIEARRRVLCAPHAARGGYCRLMPFKHHAARRHHIPRAVYRARNWPAYEAGLKRRGDLTLWIEETALAGWQAGPRTTPGGQRQYSDLAISLVLALRLVFRLALRQAEGFVASVLRLLHLDLPMPDHTTLSRRGRKFAGRTPGVAAGEARHIVIDSTGLQVFGYGAWHGEKYGYSRRSWRKLHIAVDAGTGEILASTLTGVGGDDAGEMPDLLAQVQGPIASVTADGAYDHDAVYQAVAARQPQPPPEVVIPPRASAVASRHQTQRDDISARSPNVAGWRGRRRPATDAATSPRRRSAATRR